MNNFQMLMIIFIFYFSHISSPPERETSNSNNDDLDATMCNYGKHHVVILKWCNCRNVLGNGPHCKIEKLFNNTHGQIIVATVPDHLDSWKKNLETQFPNEKINIVEETKNDVRGFVDNNIYFHLHFLPNITEKRYYLRPRSILQTIARIFSKKNNNANVSNEEEMNKGNETSKTNETKMVKDYYNWYYITRVLLAVGLPLSILGLIKLFWKNIKKFNWCPTKNRLRSNIEHEGHNVGEEHELFILSGNRNAEVTLGSNIENEEQKVGEEQGLSDFSGNPNAEVPERSDQTLFDVQKNNENNDIQIVNQTTF